MNFTESIKTVLFQKYATFNGRASRSEYWWFYLFTFLIGFIGLLNEVLNIIIGLLILIPSIAVAVRRLHDTNHSGWHLLGSFGFFAAGGFIAAAGGEDFGVFIVFLGIIYLLYILYLTIKKGDESDNQYGPNPLISESTEDKANETIEPSVDIDLNTLTVKELKDLAMERGVKLLSKDTKSVIIKKLSEFSKQENKISSNSEEATTRLSEEALYEQVAQEIEDGKKRPGLWLKAKSESNGDEAKAESIYIQLRVQSIVDEMALEDKAKQERITEENERLRFEAGKASGTELSSFLNKNGYTLEISKGRYHAKAISNPTAPNPSYVSFYSSEDKADVYLWVKDNPNRS